MTVDARKIKLIHYLLDIGANAYQGGRDMSLSETQAERTGQTMRLATTLFLGS